MLLRRLAALLLMCVFVTMSNANALPGFFKSKASEDAKKDVKEEKKSGIFCDKCKASSEYTSLLIELEERDIKQDKIQRYELFDNGLLVENVIHEGDASKGDLYKSEMKIVKQEKIAKVKSLVEQLQNLEYSNFFPWKEDYYDRGNVVKFKFPDEIKLNCFKRKLEAQNADSTAECPDALVSQVYVYYTGHQESPELFAEILNFIKEL